MKNTMTKKKKKIQTNNLTFGLFNFRNPITNLKYIPIYFKRLAFLLKHGYSPMAQWETYHWFICVMREIFTFYKNERVGDMPIEDVSEDKWKDMNDELYDNLLSLLDDMDEEKYCSKDTIKMERAKEEFFKLFSKYFYDFWD